MFPTYSKRILNKIIGLNFFADTEHNCNFDLFNETIANEAFIDGKIAPMFHEADCYRALGRDRLAKPKFKEVEEIGLKAIKTLKDNFNAKQVKALINKIKYYESSY